MVNLISISDARANLPKLVKKAGGGIERFLITIRNKPQAVVIGIEELEALEIAAEISTMSEAKKSIKRGLKQAEKGEGIALCKL